MEKNKQKEINRLRKEAADYLKKIADALIDNDLDYVRSVMIDMSSSPYDSVCIHIDASNLRSDFDDFTCDFDTIGEVLYYIVGGEDLEDEDLKDEEEEEFYVQGSDL